MSKIIRYILLFSIAGFIISGCQPSVRFSRNTQTATEKSDKKLSEEKASEKKSESKMEEEIGKDLSDSQKAILKEAEHWIGTPYCHGGESQDCIDCSGFTMNVYEKIGINLPRSAAEQYDFSVIVDKKKCCAGDLVFFGETSHISHVGIYAGNGEFIHSSSSKGVVRQSLSDPYFKKKFVGFGKVNKNS
jgi:cell wall-associated NlpC family hydrolase